MSFSFAHLGDGESATGNAMWTESAAVRALAAAYNGIPEFPSALDQIRAGKLTSRQIALRGLQRNQGDRALVLETLIEAGLSAPNPKWVHSYMAMTRGLSFFVDGELDPCQPSYRLRVDAADRIGRAAIRVARRTFGRCAEPSCCPDPVTGRGSGARLSKMDIVDEKTKKSARQVPSSDYCTRCEELQPTKRSDVDGEVLLFARASAWLLDGERWVSGPATDLLVVDVAADRATTAQRAA